jgi:colicin import membrane protein
MTHPTGDARPWIGSAVLHVAIIAALALAAVRWRSDPPPPQLAIEGSVVRYEDLPPSVKSGKPMREPTPAPRPAPVPPPPAVPEPRPDPAADAAAAAALEKQQAAAAARAEAAAERRRETQAAEQALAAEKKARAAAASAEKQRQQAAEARERQEAQQREAAAARQKQQDEAAAARAAKARAEQEARLQRELADEEAGEAVAQSGVVDEYRAMLVQAIQRSWIRPPSARAGLECTLHVTQAAGGTVLDVKVGECNGDQAVRESVANAVYRSSPLPPPRDPRAFQRNLVIVFKPTE